MKNFRSQEKSEEQTYAMFLAEKDVIDISDVQGASFKLYIDVLLILNRIYMIYAYPRQTATR